LVGEPPELVVHHRHQHIPGGGIVVSPGRQQPGDLLARV